MEMVKKLRNKKFLNGGKSFGWGIEFGGCEWI